MRKIQKCHENPLDNILINISDSLCPLFKKLGFTPNGITTLSLIFGLAAVYALYKGKVWGFAILYFISYFFDNMDGHYARKYGMTSKFGDYYDHIKDIVVVLVLLGVLITRNRCSRKVWITAGAILAVAFVLMSAQLGCQEKIYKSTPDPTDESPSLSFTSHLCPGDPEKSCGWLRWFGCGTFVLVFIAVIVYMESSNICRV